MKPKPQFSKRPFPVPRKDPFEVAAKVAAKVAANYDREERAAIHEFDGQLPRPEAEARAAAECQHCGQAAALQPVWRASYGHGLDVCAECADALMATGWERGSGPQPERLF